MLSPEALNSIKQLLWSTPRHAVYALADGASIPKLLERLYSSPKPQFECLFPGSLAPDMAEVAPYLVALDPASDFADWMIAHGWGNHWTSFAIAQCDLRAAWFHLRQLNIVYGPNSRPMLFRYYDPRVLRAFLPTCNAEQVMQMFGPVGQFVAEDQAGAAALVFAHNGGELQQSARPVAGASR